MGLDVYLRIPEPRSATPEEAIFVRRGGATVEITRAEWDLLYPGREPVMATVNSEDSDQTEVYSANITHNLGKMAAKAGLYEALWYPEEVGITKAHQLVDPLTSGLSRLRSDPALFRTFDASNGWGTYENLVVFVDRYLAACKDHPGADVSVWR